jgi:hypothetical protein
MPRVPGATPGQFGDVVVSPGWVAVVADVRLEDLPEQQLLAVGRLAVIWRPVRRVHHVARRRRRVRRAVAAGEALGELGAGRAAAGARPVVEARRPVRLDAAEPVRRDGVDQRERRDRPVVSGVRGDGRAAGRPAGQVHGPVDVERTHERAGVVGPVAQPARRVDRGELRVAEAAHVRRDDPEAVGRCGEHVLEEAAGREVAVHHHDRDPVCRAGLEVVHPEAIGVGGVRLDARQHRPVSLGSGHA